MQRKNSQTRVGLNAKIESLNILPIPYDGVAVIEDGFPVSLDSTSGYGKNPATGATEVVFINFVDSSRADVAFIQRDGFDTTALTASIQGGGLSGLQGGIDIGLPDDVFVGNVRPTIGQGLQVDAGGRWKPKTLVSGDRHYGICYRIAENRAWFQFSTNPVSF